MDTPILQNPLFLQLLLDSVQEGIYITDFSRNIIFWNRGAENITGFPAKDVVGSSCGDNLLNHVDSKGNKLCSTGCPLLQALEEGTEQEARLFLRHRAGHRVPVKVRIIPLKDSGGKVLGAAETFSDDSPQSSAAEKLNLYRDLALKDEVTGIGNRRYGEIYLRSRLAAFQESKWPFGVGKIAVNGIQEINASYGHTQGDQLLKIVATSISKIMGTGDFIARWGGGEFLLILPSARTKADVIAAGNRFKLVAQRSSLWVEGRIILPSISFGGTVVEEGDFSEALLQRVSRALLASKNHREHLVIFC
jgi:diguanylate cyclase (GGDEF)-like protein/PAS domain S-box-containing protein